MDASVAAVLATIVIALAFDFINGFHDAANSIATVVSTRVLSPGFAVVWAATFNFIAVFVFGTAVAKTIGKGMIDISVVDTIVTLSGLSGAIAWDLITWWGGLPTSSSHALIGGYAGAAVAKAGLGAIIAAGWVKTLVFIVVAPVMGLVLAITLTVILAWVLAVRCRGKWIAASAHSSCCQPLRTPWDTGPTTRRRRWALSSASWRHRRCGPSSRRPSWGSCTYRRQTRSRCGSSARAAPPWGLVRCPVAGGSCGPWDSGSPS
jgi:phosphate/sulfate permease